MILNTLSGRFLMLTIGFVLLAEVLIFVPSVANFRMEYLSERLERAQIASLTLLATDDGIIPADLEEELILNVDVRNIALRRDEIRELVLSSRLSGPVSATYDLRDATAVTLIGDAFVTIFMGGDRVIRVLGEPVKNAGLVIEIAMEEAPLRSAMLDYARRVTVLSLVLSVFTAAALFLVVRYVIVRPIKRVADNMHEYMTAPEDARTIIKPMSSIKEIRNAEIALETMQRQLSRYLKQKDHLATLGTAVSKISHDLRNMLTTASLVGEMMEMSDDPRVTRSVPKLMNSLSRASNLCEQTLAFGKAEELPPTIVAIKAHRLLEDVAEGEQLAVTGVDVKISVKTEPDLVLELDEEQIHRVLSNLTRNARQAFESAKKDGEILLTAASTDGGWILSVRDNGPGLPQKAKENLFKAFQGGARQGGTGLGLAVSRELVWGHNGAIELTRSDENGTEFTIFLPHPS